MIAPQSDTQSGLKKHAAGPWISVGGYLDYEAWEERERFKWLDMKIRVESARPEQDELRERDARVILAAAQGRTYQQIADELNLSAANVRMIMSMWRSKKGRFAEPCCPATQLETQQPADPVLSWNMD